MTAPAGEQQQEKENRPERGNAEAQNGSGGAITQEQMNKLLAAQKRDIESKFEGYDELKAKAGQLDQLTDSAKTELERANSSAADFKSKWESEQGASAKLKTQLLRQQIGATEKLDPDLWDRVTGDTADEIEADVKKLVAKFGTTGGGRPSKGLQSGASAPDGSTPKQRAANALRGLGPNR